MADEMKIATVSVEYFIEVMRVIVREEFVRAEEEKPKPIKLYTSKEIMKILNISESTFRRWVKLGNIKSVKINGRIRVKQEGLDALQKEVKSLKYKRS